MGNVICLASAIHRRRVASIMAEREAQTARAANERRAAIVSEYADLAGPSGALFGEIVADVREAMERAEKAATAPAFVPAYCDPDNERKGTKYEATRGLWGKDLAARIRADIKQAQKAGRLDARLKISTRFESYSGGYSIDVRLTRIPDGWTIYNPDYLRHEEANRTGPFNPWRGETYSPEYRAARDVLKELHGAYNRDNSDSMTDYFDVRYYGDVGIYWELERDARKAETARALSETNEAKEG